MSIKQNESTDEDLLLLLPAAAKWISGDNYKLGGGLCPTPSSRRASGGCLSG